jgi:adenylosuccinate synthase
MMACSQRGVALLHAGTTKKGIGPAYAAKINRVGCRVGDLQNWEEFEARFRVCLLPGIIKK